MMYYLIDMPYKIFQHFTHFHVLTAPVLKFNPRGVFPSRTGSAETSSPGTKDTPFQAFVL